MAPSFLFPPNYKQAAGQGRACKREDQHNCGDTACDAEQEVCSAGQCVSSCGDGALTMLDADGVTGQAGMAPVDEDVTDGNDLLYVVNNGSHSFSIFQINADARPRPALPGPTPKATAVNLPATVSTP